MGSAGSSRPRAHAAAWTLALASIAPGAGPGLPGAETPPGHGPDEILLPATVNFPPFRVSPGGYLPHDDNPGTRACQNVSSHTDANFEGGTFVVQAGFAETEIAGASYVLSASAFPIRIDMTEVIVATSGSTIPTTTKWTMLFWSGTPSTGTLVASYSSDGESLPHIEIPAGTNGVNLQFSIDPSDPEQIIINDPGNHTFSIGFRIDDHNQQTGNPCSVSPPTCCNAFPTTDVSGLAQSSNNWLYGVNCGPFGCPPNGGWARFSQLSAACRPSGDWVMRATWTTLNCNPTGACCFNDGTCQVLSASACATAGGTYKGDDVTCAAAGCQAITGACCFSNNFCLALTQANCAGAGGTWVGAGTTCGANNTCPTGACCLPLGDCVTGLTQAQCAAQGGTFRGVGSTCASANCPQPTGACCTSTGFCLSLTAADCAGIPGASWAGPLTTCADNNGNGTADICESGCAADFNGDGFLTGDDYDGFVWAFEAGDPSADYNGDQFVTGDDFDRFTVDFELGC